MKIYFNVTDTDLESFAAYVKEVFPIATGYVTSGYHCLDNTNNSLHTLSSDEFNDIPSSFILKWDKQRIDDLFKNRVLARFNEGKPQWTLMNASAMLPMINVLAYGKIK